MDSQQCDVLNATDYTVKKSSDSKMFHLQFFKVK